MPSKNERHRRSARRKFSEETSCSFDYSRSILGRAPAKTIHRSDISCERDQADSYERLGALLESRAREESRSYLRKSLEIWERWRSRTPSNPYVQARWKSVVSLLR